VISQLMVAERLELTVFYNAHGSAEDLGDGTALRERFKSSDIALLESFGWYEAWRQEQERITQGDQKQYKKSIRSARTMDGRPMSAWNIRLAEAMYNTGCLVVSPDVPYDSELYWRIKPKAELLKARVYGLSFREQLRIARQKIASQVEFVYERDRYIADHTFQVVADAVEKNGEAYGSEPIKATLLVGYQHYDVVPMLVEKANELGCLDIISRIEETSYDGSPLGYIYEVPEKHKRGEALSKLDLTRWSVCGFVEQEHLDEIAGMTTIEKAAYIKGIVEPLTLNQLQRIYNRWTNRIML